jgi:hypothetical protein
MDFLRACTIHHRQKSIRNNDEQCNRMSSSSSSSSSLTQQRHRGLRRNTIPTSVNGCGSWGRMLLVVVVLFTSLSGAAAQQQAEDGTTTTTTTTTTTKSNVCLMLYQMADNDLEYFIRRDNLELIQSEGIRQPNLNTWVYFDHRNYNLGSISGGGSGIGDDDAIITEPLPMVYEKDGSDVPSNSYKPMGSQYLHYDHTLQKMIIDRTLQEEQDGDSPLTLQTFLEVAMTDCIEQYQLDQQQQQQQSTSTIDITTTTPINNNTIEYVLIFASHGSGWLGFGGDENKERRRRIINRRQLVERQQQSNADIIGAIQTALGNVENAPTKFDVIGFDACNMQGVGTVDDYQDVSKYFLASESVEPGHGTVSYIYVCVHAGNV